MFHIIKNYFINLYFNIHIWYYKYIAKFFYLKPKLIECELPEWIDITSLIYLNNTYQLVNTNITNTNNVEKEYYSFYKNFYSNYIYSDKVYTDGIITKEHVFISKSENKYLCRVCFPGHIKTICMDEKEDEKKEISFLYIEYFHPTKMEQSISLPFPNEMLQPLNELFTPAFVLRQLQTQTEYYYFDMDYILTILDQDLQTFKLKSNQYIFLHHYTYEIMDRIEKKRK